eukprot:4322627-Pyramimonas_sp.AAC.1
MPWPDDRRWTFGPSTDQSGKREIPTSSRNLGSQLLRVLVQTSVEALSSARTTTFMGSSSRFRLGLT